MTTLLVWRRCHSALASICAFLDLVLHLCISCFQRTWLLHLELALAHLLLAFEFVQFGLVLENALQLHPPDPQAASTSLRGSVLPAPRDPNATHILPQRVDTLLLFLCALVPYTNCQLPTRHLGVFRVQVHHGVDDLNKSSNTITWTESSPSSWSQG